MNRIPWALSTKAKQPELDGNDSLASSVEFKASRAVNALTFKASCCAQTQLYLYLSFIVVFISAMLFQFVYSFALFMT